MANQDDIIIIRTVESITTSILDYFLNIALVTEIDDATDLVDGQTFSPSDIETYSSLSNWDSSYPTDYTNDLSVTDSLSNTIETRTKMYNPMYYLNSYYDGYQTSDVADYFRINTGITQGDTSNVVEMNLYLALINYGKTATFTTVLNQGHTEAERSGSATDNFISWIAGIEGTSTSTSTTSTDATTSTTSTTNSTIDTSTDIDSNENITIM